MSDDWMGQEITLRQHLQEAMMIQGAPWIMAVEAVDTTLMEHPEVDADQVRTRQEWLDRGRD